MPIHTLENTWLKASFKSLGAELCSLFHQVTYTEHIWQADPAAWNRHAPVLFPIVGQVENNTYSVGEQSFPMTQHGFARDKEFRLEVQTADSLVFVLESDENTLKNYPYQFRLYISYTLKLDQLEVSYRVVNTDEGKIFFSVGAHPAFVCPFGENETFSDYVLEFEKPETSRRLLFSSGLLTGEKQEEYLQNSSAIQLSYDLFKDDAIILEGLKSAYVDLKSLKTGKFLRFYFKGFPLLAFWTKPGVNADFICIEPWFGIADIKGERKDFSEKPYIQFLEVCGSFECSYRITVSD